VQKLVETSGLCAVKAKIGFPDVKCAVEGERGKSIEQRACPVFGLILYCEMRERKASAAAFRGQLKAAEFK
jgi:hypothetical protein